MKNIKISIDNLVNLFFPVIKAIEMIDEEAHYKPEITGEELELKQ